MDPGGHLSWLMGEVSYWETLGLGWGSGFWSENEIFTESLAWLPASLSSATPHTWQGVGVRARMGKRGV